MKLGVISKIRNEFDILPLFLRHLDALFDVAYLIDHKSVDGTERLLKQAAKKNSHWKYFYLDFHGHFHSQVSSFFMHEIFKENVDFVFFLDTDEFIFVKDRFELENNLENLFINDIPFSLNRMNCVPNNMHNNKISEFTKIWFPNHSTEIPKVVVSAQMYFNSKKDLWIDQGNHHAVKRNGFVYRESNNLGDLLHIPVRSLTQIQKKYIIKCIAYRAIENRNQKQGFHNFKILNLIAQGKYDDDSLRGLVGLYEKEIRKPLVLSRKELINLEYQETTLMELDVALSQQSFDSNNQETISDLRVIADAVNNWEIENVDDINFELENNILKIKPFVKDEKTNSIKKTKYLSTYIRKLMRKINNQYKSIIKVRFNEKSKKYFSEEFYNKKLLIKKVDNDLKDFKNRSIDIIICVHDALLELEQCIASIIPTLEKNHRIIIVDDFSSAKTKKYLDNLHKNLSEQIKIVYTENQIYYTKAANLGLSESSADFVILLNSDTIVSKNWSKKLAQTVFMDSDYGIVGPFSNAANLQSIPSIKRENGNSAINPLPKNRSIEEINNYLENWSQDYGFTYLPIIHGFCFGIKRSVLEKIGQLDDATFPMGYGEEADYCFRAIEAGFIPVISTNTYVFHAKSKSYPDKLRIALMKKSRQLLLIKHNEQKVALANKLIKSNRVMQMYRKKFKQLF